MIVDETEFKKEIKRFIEYNFHLVDDEKKLDDRISLMDAGIINSTGVLEMIEFIEEKFCISIENNEVIPENLDSVNNIVKFITMKIEKLENGR
jgi:acyl carrier protein